MDDLKFTEDEKLKSELINKDVPLDEKIEDLKKMRSEAIFKDMLEKYPENGKKDNDEEKDE